MDTQGDAWSAVSAIVKGWSPERRNRYVGKPMMWHFPLEFPINNSEATFKTMAEFSAN